MNRANNAYKGFKCIKCDLWFRKAHLFDRHNWRNHNHLGDFIVLPALSSATQLHLKIIKATPFAILHVPPVKKQPAAENQPDGENKPAGENQPAAENHQVCENQPAAENHQVCENQPAAENHLVCENQPAAENHQVCANELLMHLTDAETHCMAKIATTEDLLKLPKIQDEKIGESVDCTIVLDIYPSQDRTGKVSYRVVSRLDANSPQTSSFSGPPQRLGHMKDITNKQILGNNPALYPRINCNNSLDAGQPFQNPYCAELERLASLL